MNVRIDVSSPGGHSSVPPSHTVRSLPFSYSEIVCLIVCIQSIGMLAAVLVEYENNPYPVHFVRLLFIRGAGPYILHLTPPHRHANHPCTPHSNVSLSSGLL